MTPVLQLVVVPYRASVPEEEVDELLRPALEILHKTDGLLAHWQGDKHEQLRTKGWLLLWNDLMASQDFFTSPAYGRFVDIMKPILLGREIEWNTRAFCNDSPGSSLQTLANVVDSPAIEVATTHVVNGKVSGYYGAGAETGPLMAAVEGFQGAFLSPSIEDPNRQVLLLNWKSVEAHHVIFENTPAFTKCIDLLSEYYAKFVVPWHIVKNKLIFGGIPLPSD